MVRSIGERSASLLFSLDSTDLTTSTPSTDLAPVNRGRQIAKTIGYFAALAGIGLSSASLGPTLPALALQTQSQLYQISILFTARSFGDMLGSLQGGRLYDRLPAHRVMAAMLVMISAMLILVPIIPLLWLLALVAFILGASEGMVNVGGNILLVWNYRQRVGPYLNGLHFFFGLGAFISPLLVAQALLMRGVFGVSGVRLAYWTLALLMIPIALWLARLPSPAPYTRTEPGKPQAINVWLVALIAVFFFLYVGAEASYGAWIFTYATRMLQEVSGGATTTAVQSTAAYLTSAFWGSLTVGRLLAVPLATRVKPRPTLIADLIGCLASLVIILLWPNSYTMLWVGTIAFGLANASVYPTMLAYAERRLALSGNVARWFFMGSGAGGMFLPWLIGQLFDRLGPGATMCAIFVSMALTALVLMTIVLYLKRSEPGSGD